MHAAAEENGAVDGRTAFIAAQRGDAAAQAVVDHYLDDPACGVANIVNIFFPEVIALSGGVANQGDALLVPLPGEGAAGAELWLTLCRAPHVH